MTKQSSIAALCKTHRRRVYYYDGTGLIGVYNHRHVMLWYRWTRAGYSLVGETATPLGATMRSINPPSGKMPTAKEKRHAFLLPAGIPRWIRVYDNGGETFDRFTVVFTGRYRHETAGQTQVVGMSKNPFHPQGFGQHGEYPNIIDTNKWGYAPAMGRSNHLGKRIAFADLPQDCQKLILSDYRELWDLES